MLLDPLELDRTLARLAQSRESFVRALKVGRADEHRFELLPRGLDSDLLQALRDAGEHALLAAPSLRWAEYLLVENAITSEALRFSRAFVREAHALDTPARGEFTLSALRENALSDGTRRDAWFSALSERSAAASAARFRLFEAEASARERLGAAPLVPTALRARVRAAAERSFEVTREPYRELAPRSLAELVEAGLGRGVPGSFPARLSPRALAEYLQDGAWLHGVTPELAELPRLLGVSSFLRALAAFGRALHDAGQSPRRPFVLAREPLRTRSHEYGALFALLPLLPRFAERRLDIGRARYSDYARGVWQLLVIGLRELAFSALLSAESERGERAYRAAFVEQGYAAFGFELPSELAGVLFVDPLASAKLSGVLLAFTESARLIERHDEDWFRNPRAVSELRGEFESPEPTELPEGGLERGLERLASELSAAL